MRSLVPVLVSGLMVVGLFAGCIGGGEGGAKGPGGSSVGGGSSVVVPPDENTGAVEGIVTDLSISEFFVGARVTVTKGGIANVVANATTDDLGQYYVGGLEPGEYKVFVDEVDDHKPAGKSVNVVAGSVATLNFALAPLPRIEPRDEIYELNYFIACGTGLPPGAGGQAQVTCGAQDPNQRHTVRFEAERGMSTLVVAARWSAPCVGCDDGKPWLIFILNSPAGTKFKSWTSSGPEMTKRYEFNLSEEVQDFVTGNWSLQVFPNPGNSSRQYLAEKGGLVQQMRVSAWATLGYDSYYIPPEYTGIPDS